MNPREHIKNIQYETVSSDRVKEILNNSIEKLSKDLYHNDTHFIFELIQNAEDNKYDNSSEPTLVFHLLSTNPTNTPNSNGTLLIENNEVGFSEENVDAICSVGKSTKKKIEGYIGEKGIGFKSVFKASSLPHIYSHGYEFNLPEHDESSGFGFIYPRWVDSIPDKISPSGTTIILPLNKNDYNFDKMERDICDIKSEIILFLSKLKKLNIIIDEHYERTIWKDDSQYPLVKIWIETYDNSSNTKHKYVERYWVHTKSFDVPENAFNEKRADIQNRLVTVAFPLSPTSSSAGQIFAYLPIQSNSGLPFLVNADFLLTAGREGIESNKWNEWLRDCVAEVFVESFEKAIGDEKQRIGVYKFIPLNANNDFLRPIVESIQEQLQYKKIILTQPALTPCLPEDTMTAPIEFHSLITEPYPEYLLGERLVCPELKGFEKQLTSIGVGNLASTDIIKCLKDKKWIEHHGQNYEWLVRCYKYLKSMNIDDLTDCPIVPIRCQYSGQLSFSCALEQQIYFRYDIEAMNILYENPSCVKPPFAFIDENLFQFIGSDEESNKIKSFMADCLGIKTFSKSVYIRDVIDWFKNNFINMKNDDIINVTCFIAQFSNIRYIDIPILLDTGRCDLISKIRAHSDIQEIVVPRALNRETGWQNIYSYNDCNYLAVLSNDYINDNDSVNQFKDLWGRIGISSYPAPEYSKDNCYVINNGYLRLNDGFDSYERRLVEAVRPRSAESRLNDMIIWNYHFQYMIETLDDDIKEMFSKSMIHWFNHKIKNIKISQEETLYDCGLLLKIDYFNHIKYTRYGDSTFIENLKTAPWLSTTKGFVKPSEAFVSKTHIKELLGDSVPYIVDDISDKTIELLGIRNEATSNELINILLDHSDNNDDSNDFAYRVYKHLNSIELDQDIIFRLKTSKLIYIASEEGKWVSLSDVIWFDQSDILGDDFVYLEKIYPDLHDFFVIKLGAKDNVDKESFAKRWLSIQNDNSISFDEIEKVLSKIYKELLPICKEDNRKKPDWWHEFIQNAQVWTQGHTFVDAKCAYIPDEGDLKKIFRGMDIHFAWRPEHNSFLQWEPLYRELDIAYLSESVTISLVDEVRDSVTSDIEYLTVASKTLLETWLQEKAPSDYERLQKTNVLRILRHSTEAYSKSIRVKYALGSKERVTELEAYWNQKDGCLLLSYNSNSEKLKNAIARTLARALMTNRAYKDFANWIELVLCEKDWKWRVEQSGWKVPVGMRIWLNTGTQSITRNKQNWEKMGKDNTILSDDMGEIPKKEVPNKYNKIQDNHPENISVPPLSETNISDDILPPTPFDMKETDNHVEKKEKKYPIDVSDLNIHRGNHKKIVEIPLDEGTVKNPSHAGGRILDMHKNNIDIEPEYYVRRRTTERTILEGPNENVREHLKHLYGGKCQICGSTFPEGRTGEPFFIANYIIERKKARFCDTYENALCLCPDHFAKWQHGKLDAEILDQIMALQAENTNNDLFVKIKLCEEECKIRYRPKHIFAMQKFIKSLI